MSDEALLNKTQKLAGLERKVSVRLIAHLQEVDHRRLHHKRGFRSLYDYLIRGLGYSSAAAHRRIQAMEICRELPEVSAKIENGALNLTQAMQLQGFFENQTLEPEAKRELVEKVQGLSTRETERVLAAEAPAQAPRDRTRAISGELTQITFAADQELMEMLERIKNLGAHQTSGAGYLELFKLMARKTLERLDPAKRAKRARSQTPAPGDLRVDGRRPDAATEYALHERDRDGCQYVDAQTGRKCGSRFAIQVDHKIPYGLGGATRLSNLQLLCRAHNRLRAVEVYGRKAMERYLRV